MATESKKLRTYLQCILIGWPIATALAVLVGLASDYEFFQTLVPALAIGFLFSVLLSVGLVRRLMPIQGDAILRPSMAIVLSAPYENGFRTCEEALESLSNIRLRKVDRGAGSIEATTIGSQNPLGERISLRISERGPHQTEVALSSRPRQPLLIFDYGENEACLQAIANRIKD